MASFRDVLSEEDRAELDAILLGLPRPEANLVRLIEIFMSHELSQAALFNEEVRLELGRMRGRLNSLVDPATITARFDQADKGRSEIARRLDDADSYRRRVLERLGALDAMHKALLDRLAALEDRPAPARTGPWWIWVAVGAAVLLISLLSQVLVICFVLARCV